MSRKFRPTQCPECRYYRQVWVQGSFSGKHKPHCALLYYTSNHHPAVKLIGRATRPCPNFEPKTEEVETMSRKFRPTQCPKCSLFRPTPVAVFCQSDTVRIGQQVKLVNVTYLPCHWFIPKKEGGG